MVIPFIIVGVKLGLKETIVPGTGRFRIVGGMVWAIETFGKGKFLGWEKYLHNSNTA